MTEKLRMFIHTRKLEDKASKIGFIERVEFFIVDFLEFIVGF
ncbi:hypothetical protein [Planococcus halotolerans]|nr:hypothetical protein [Planococcus halotolerans]